MKLGIEKPSDWGKYKVSELVRAGGGKVLSMYGKSPIRMLKSVYTGNEAYLVLY